MQVKEISNKNLWDKFISVHSPQSLFQSWNWGEVIKKTKDDKVVFLNRFGLFNNKNQLTGIFQAVKVTARRGTFLQIRHGPVLSDWSSKNLLSLKNILIKLALAENVSFVRLSPLITPEKKRILLFKKLGFINSPIPALDGEYCWVLDLNKSESELLGGMRKTTRYLIRWAMKNNVDIKKSTDLKDMAEFLALYDETASRQGFIKHHGIKEELEIFAKDNQALLFKGYYQQKLRAAAIIIFYQHQAIYHHSASLEQKIPVNYLIQWQAILEAKKRQLSIYNYWGIAPPGRPRHPWNNLTLFKKGFGGRIVEYFHCQDLPVKKLAYFKTHLIENLRKITKGY